MGAMLPKAVTPVVVERSSGSLFRVGFAEMHGWRKGMEDAHAVVMKDTWGFFGVFDGHGGDQCSNFIEKRVTKELEEGEPPVDDAAMKEMMLRLDREFLATGQPSGSTGTFTLVTPNADKTGYQLRVGNIGDSRVLLGHADGSIFKGPGTDSGLTTDHKPDHPDEIARINRTGDHVEDVQGVPRVNGDLAVSRSFGDAPHKTTGGPGQEDHPVSAEPEMATFNCDATDFLILVCDGISEGSFPNPEVVKLAAEKLRAGGDQPDPAAAAAAVCQKALECDSKDNLSCMIVLFGGGQLAVEKRALLSGPLQAPAHGGYRKAYEGMAKHAGLTFAQAVELRYDDVRQLRLAKVLPKGEDQPTGSADAESLKALHQELAGFGDGPPSSLACGSDERIKWFQDWLDGFDVQDDPEPSSMTRPQLLDLIETRPDFLAMAQAQGIIPSRIVRIAPLEKLRTAMGSSSSLRWTDEHARVAGECGMVIFDDELDGTSRVKFSNFFAWLPSCALLDADSDEANSDRRSVRVASAEVLRAAIEAHDALKWVDRLADTCGQCGVVSQDDESDGTSRVAFPPPVGLVAWLPTSALIDIDDESDASDGGLPKGAEKETEEGSEPTQKRQRSE